eukprot:4611617-Pyramimonas_sp.AAC.1
MRIRGCFLRPVDNLCLLAATAGNASKFGGSNPYISQGRVSGLFPGSVSTKTTNVTSSSSSSSSFSFSSSSFSSSYILPPTCYLLLPPAPTSSSYRLRLPPSPPATPLMAPAPHPQHISAHPRYFSSFHLAYAIRKMSQATESAQECDLKIVCR